MRWFKWIAGGMLLLALVTGGFIYWLYTSESGLQWIWSRAEQQMPTSLKVSGVTGSLAESVKIQNLVWQAEPKIEATDVSLNCHWFSLLGRGLNCSGLTLAGVALIVNDPPPAQQSSPQSSADIRALIKAISFQLPVDLKFDSVTLEELTIGTATLVETERMTFRNIGLQKLVLNNHLLKISSSRLSFQDYLIDLKASVNPRMNWPFKAEVKIASGQLKGEFISEGTLTGDASFRYTSQLPLEGRVTGRWFLDEHLRIEEGEVLLGQQALPLFGATAHPLLPELNSAKAEFTLDWPSLELSLQSDFTLAMAKALALSAKAQLKDITAWQQELLFDFQLSGELAGQALRQVSADQDYLPEGISLRASLDKDDYSIDVKAKGKLIDGGLSVTSDGANIANLITSFQFKMDHVDRPVSDLFYAGSILAENFDWLSDYSVHGTTFDWQLERTNSQWSFSSKGSADKLIFYSTELGKSTWQIALADKWQGDFFSKTIRYQQSRLKNTKLSLKGSENKHQIKGEFNLPNAAKTRFSLDGQWLAASHPSDPSYKIEKLVATIPMSASGEQNVAEGGKEVFNLRASGISISQEQQLLEQLCLKYSGEACFQASVVGKNWQAQAQINHLMLERVWLLAKQWSWDLPIDFRGQLDGSIKAAGSDEKLTQFELDLSSPELTFSKDEFALSTQKLKLASQKIASDFTVSVDWLSQHATWRFGNFNSIFLTEGGKADVRISENYDFQSLYEQADISWQLTKSEVAGSSSASLQSAKRSDAVAIKIPRLNFQAAVSQGNLSSQLNADFNSQDHVGASFNTTWPLSGDNQHEATLDYLLSDLTLVKRWFPQIDQLDGQIKYLGKSKGSLAEPQILGKGSLTINLLEVDQLGIDVKDSRVQIVNQNQRLLLTGNLKNRKGELRVDASAELFPKLSATIKLIGSKIDLLDSEESRLVVSPNITASFKDNHFDVDGKVGVDEGRIKISAIPKQSISVSEDQVILNQPVEPEDSLSYHINLEIAPLNNVTIEGFGLKSQLNGQLKAKALSGEPIALTGSLSMTEGEFKAYGQELTIEEGQLLFLGPIDNPGIQARAIRMIDDIKVGIIADGSLVNPRLSLYSQPAMEEQNILSLLLTGRSLDSLTKSEGNALANAVISLGIKGANKIASRIGELLGIKKLEVSSKTSADSTRVDIASQINEKLSVGYGTSIDSESIATAGWIIEYRLSPSVSFEAVSGEEVSASIIYRKRFDLDKD